MLYNNRSPIVLMNREDNRIERTSLVIVYRLTIRSSGMIVL